MSTHPAIAFLDDLKFRGLLNQCTDEPGLREHLRGSGAERRAYVGFDPTADSLTIGNLVGIMALARWQRGGHTPVVVMGGGTGLIGDPSGKSTERMLRTRDEVDANVQKQRAIFERVIDFTGSRGFRHNQGLLTNNIDWLGSLGYLEALRDIGKHFSVNMMIQKDSVKERLTNRDQGISYTEFSYMILQAYDFAHLFEKQGVTVQMGGSDQFGNIVVGIDLVRKRQFARLEDAHFKQLAQAGKNSGQATGFVSSKDPIEHAFGLTWPLVTKADGTKFGKTESGAIWLTANAPGENLPNRTSAYQFYQFWLNSADADVPKFLRFFTLLSHEDILALDEIHAKDPGKREAHRALARHMTELLHGKEAMQQAESAAGALFSGEIAHLPAELLEEVLASAPTSVHAKALLSGEGVSLLELLSQTTLAKSKSEARQFLSDGSVSVNGKKVGLDARVNAEHLLHGRVIALRRGKKSWHVTKWE